MTGEAVADLRPDTEGTRGSDRDGGGELYRCHRSDFCLTVSPFEFGCVNSDRLNPGLRSLDVGGGKVGKWPSSALSSVVCISVAGVSSLLSPFLFEGEDGLAAALSLSRSVDNPLCTLWSLSKLTLRAIVAGAASLPAISRLEAARCGEGDISRVRRVACAR